MDKRISLPFVKKELGLPFVKGQYKALSGQFVEGIFLIDSGSFRNVLNSRIASNIGEDKILQVQEHLGALNNQGETCNAISVELALDGSIYTAEFFISHNIAFDKMFGDDVIGILGVEFLLKYGWEINFEEGGMQLTDANLPDSFSFLFPMEYGLTKYQIPIIGIVKGENEFVFVADSGCNVSITTQNVLEQATRYKDIPNEQNTVEGIFGSTIVSLAQVEFSILGISQQEDVPYELICHHDLFEVVSDTEYLLTPHEVDILPVSGLIGTEFMLKNKWILDFRHKLIYAR